MRRLVLLALTLGPGLAAADEVYVRGGGRLTGEVVERGPESIVVDIGTGRIGLPLSYVERIVPGATPAGVYRERAADLDPADVAGWVALGRWAREHDLDAEAREAFETALATDPENATARRALDHVQLDGHWMEREEANRARGYLPLDGTWVTGEERQARLEDRREADDAHRTRAEGDARVREAEARARVAEVEAERAEADFRRAEAEARRNDLPGFTQGGGWTPWFAGTFAAYSYPVFPYPAFSYSPFRGGHDHSACGPRSHAPASGLSRPYPALATTLGTRARMPTLAGARRSLSTAPAAGGRASGRSSR